MRDSLTFRNYAYFIKTIVVTLAVLIGLAAAYLAYCALFDYDQLLHLVQRHVTGESMTVTLSPTSIGGLAIIAAVNMAIVAHGLAAIWRLCANLEQGQVFTPDFAANLRTAGAFGLAGVASSILSRTGSIALATMDNPPGQKQLAIAFGSNELFMLLMAALLLVLGQIMLEASRIEAENREFV